MFTLYLTCMLSAWVMHYFTHILPSLQNIIFRQPNSSLTTSLPSLTRSLHVCRSSHLHLNKPLILLCTGITPKWVVSLARRDLSRLPCLSPFVIAVSYRPSLRDSDTLLWTNIPNNPQSSICVKIEYKQFTFWDNLGW